MKAQYFEGTLAPTHFAPLIGQMVVSHAFMDQELRHTIIKMAKMDFNSGTSILSRLQQAEARIQVLQNLAYTKVRGIKRRSKLLALCEEMSERNSERNTIVHLLPYSYSPSQDELAYFRDINMTLPQIKVQAPLKVTPESLEILANEFIRCGVWLSMFRNGHPKWRQDSQFPWREKFHKKMRRETRKNRQTL